MNVRQRGTLTLVSAPAGADSIVATEIGVPDVAGESPAFRGWAAQPRCWAFVMNSRFLNGRLHAPYFIFLRCARRISDAELLRRFGLPAYRRVTGESEVRRQSDELQLVLDVATSLGTKTDDSERHLRVYASEGVSRQGVGPVRHR